MSVPWFGRIRLFAGAARRLCGWGGVACLVVALPGVRADEAWVKLENCRFVSHSANDGDSFHIRSHGRDYLIRLYFVDAPEHSMQIPSRVAEQAKWFDISEKAVLANGTVASERTAQWLEKPFTVYTQMIDARGASKMQRIFGMVKVGDRYLCELLVEHGLARIYGIRRNLHDGTFRWDFIRQLEALERAAKDKQLGVWAADNMARVADANERDVLRRVTLSRDVAFYTSGTMPTFRGMLKKGTTVDVISEDGVMLAVRAEFRGNVQSGTCRKRDLMPKH